LVGLAYYKELIMADRKSSIVFEQIDSMGKVNYRVVGLKNRTQPKIGEYLNEESIQKLLYEDENLTTEIKSGSLRRR